MRRAACRTSPGLHTTRSPVTTQPSGNPFTVVARSRAPQSRVNITEERSQKPGWKCLVVTVSLPWYIVLCMSRKLARGVGIDLKIEQHVFSRGRTNVASFNSSWGLTRDGPVTWNNKRLRSELHSKPWLDVVTAWSYPVLE